MNHFTSFYRNRASGKAFLLSKSNVHLMWDKCIPPVYQQQPYFKDLITRLLISNLLYLRRMPHIGPSPPSLSTGNSKNSIRFFRIPFGGGIENPFEPHIPRGITNHVTRNFHRFPRSHAINILLLRPAVRLVCKVKPKFLCEMHFYKDFMSRKGHLFNFLRARSPATRGENAI